MISNNLEATISQFLKDNEFFDNTRNRTLVRSGFLNCRDSIVGFLQSLVATANQKEDLTEVQLAAVAAYVNLIKELKTYGAWVYSGDSTNNLTNNYNPAEPQTETDGSGSNNSG